MMSNPRLIAATAKSRATDRRNRRRFGAIWSAALPVAARLHFRLFGHFSKRNRKGFI